MPADTHPRTDSTMFSTKRMAGRGHHRGGHRRGGRRPDGRRIHPDASDRHESLASINTPIPNTKQADLMTREPSDDVA